MSEKSPQEQYEALPEWAQQMVHAMKAGGYSIGIATGGFAEYALPRKLRRTGLVVQIGLDDKTVHGFFDGLRSAYVLALSLRDKDDPS